MITELDARSRAIFRRIVESYLETGEPVGSRTLAASTGLGLSPATIRNTMADLTDAGLLQAPHASAGRLPTERGLRLFVDAMLEIGDVSEDERRTIEARIAGAGYTMEQALEQASSYLSGLSQGAGLVVAPTHDVAVRHMEFVRLSEEKILVVLVHEDGHVENRLVPAPPGLTASDLAQATNYLSARLRGRTLAEARERIVEEVKARRAALDQLAAKLVETGVADWSPRAEGDGALIIRGRARLLEDAAAADDLERIRMLFDELEQEKDILELLELAKTGEGVRIFIGSENKLFSLSGSAVIAAPYIDSRQRVVGVLGVIGPTRLNYARVVPMVDYTAKVLGGLIG